MPTPTPSAGAAPTPAGPAGAAEVSARLRELYPDARTELEHRDAFELLVATVLSAQTTDVRVNSVTPELFSAWPDAAALAAAEESEVTDVVRPLGMGPTRARRIIGLARGLLAEHGGEVPDDQAALEALPGVGRKTAHVVRGAWFGRSLLAVDTHVGRLARRLGWTAATDPRAVEEDVVAAVRSSPPAGPQSTASGEARTESAGPPAGPADRAEHPQEPEEDLAALSLRLILHGRRICTARSPRCPECVLDDVCPSAGAV
ncbi:endonuclease III domain-containing protein [Brachybacterium sp. GCM10030268]|uniref:endonuclease III domain-containing protein n=1 Tax=Brachybacterium sp. GCM10030268 TaxID=3273382 RepID=UPI003621B2BA